MYKARQLRKIYQMGEVEVQALKGVDLDLDQGEFVVILGPSGSGKSTLLNILGGIDAPTSGELSYQGQDLVHLSERELTTFRRSHVGFVFQFYNLIPSLNAIENVSLVAGLSNRSMRPLEALQLVGLEERQSHFPAQLSGGEQQRVAIARAVVKNPSLLFCDEPTGALDYSTGKQVLDTLIRVNENLKTLVVIITHNAAMAKLADRVIMMANGLISRTEKNATRLRPKDISW